MALPAVALKSTPAKNVWNFISLWTKKIHTYTGLLNFTILIVFGIAGLASTFEKENAGFRKPETFTRSFVAPPNSDDYQAATAACQFLNFPMWDPLPRQVVRRDAANNVSFVTGSQNALRNVTLLEKERLVKVVLRRRDLWSFLNVAHTVTAQNNSRRILIRMWSWYTEFSIWSLLFMSVSGVYLWLCSRPGHRWAQVSFGLGTAIFMVLYIFSR